MLEQILKHYVTVTILVQRAEHVTAYFVLQFLVSHAPLSRFRLEEKVSEICFCQALGVWFCNFFVHFYNTPDLVRHVGLPFPSLFRRTDQMKDDAGVRANIHSSQCRLTFQLEQARGCYFVTVAIHTNARLQQTQLLVVPLVRNE